MEDKRFDSLTKALASGASRRSVFKGLLGLGAAAVTGAVVVGDGDGVEAARRPTPTPTPPKCPGVQTWDGTKCACPTGLSQCVPGVGPACCNDLNVDPGEPGYSTCCDNACCQGTCYAEELCCATNSRPGELPPTNRICNTVNGDECCLFSDVCCVVDGCCATVCTGGITGLDFCCPADDFCPGGSESPDLCCAGNTTCCAGGTNSNACVDLSQPNACCDAGDCSAVDDCTPAACIEHVCNTTSVCAAGETCCGDGVEDCFDLQTDNNNCGACGHICPGCSTCQAGVCRADNDECPESQVCCPSGNTFTCETGPNCGCDNDDDCNYLDKDENCIAGHCSVTSGVGTCVEVPAANTVICHPAGDSAICDPAIMCSGSAMTCPEPDYPGSDTDCGDCSTCNGEGACIARCGVEEDCCPDTDKCVPDGATCCTADAQCTDPCETCNEDLGYCVTTCTIAEACCTEGESPVCCSTAAGSVCCDGVGCVDTNTDSRNCGACGHICPGCSTCQAGICTANNVQCATDPPKNPPDVCCPNGDTFTCQTGPYCGCDVDGDCPACNTCDRGTCVATCTAEQECCPNLGPNNHGLCVLNEEGIGCCDSEDCTNVGVGKCLVGTCNTTTGVCIYHAEDTLCGDCGVCSDAGECSAGTCSVACEICVQNLDTLKFNCEPDPTCCSPACTGCQTCQEGSIGQNGTCVDDQSKCLGCADCSNGACVPVDGNCDACETCEVTGNNGICAADCTNPDLPQCCVLPAGEFCIPEDAVCCDENADCPTDLPFCDVPNHVCVECLVAGDCTDLPDLCYSAACTNHVCEYSDTCTGTCCANGFCNDAEGECCVDGDCPIIDNCTPADCLDTNLCNTTSVCPVGQTCCGTDATGCKNLQTDDNNCGACGTKCDGCTSCQAGVCKPNNSECDVAAGEVCCPSGINNGTCQPGPNCGCDNDNDCNYLDKDENCIAGHCSVTSGVGTCVEVPAANTVICHPAGDSPICDPAIMCSGSAMTCPEPDYPGSDTDCGDCATCNGEGACIARCSDLEQCCVLGSPVGDVCVPTGETCCDSAADCTEDCEVCNDVLHYCISSCDPTTEKCCPGTDNCAPSDATCCDDISDCSGLNYCDDLLWHTFACGTGGYCVENQPIDCNDNNLCSNDSCHAATGCSSTPVTCTTPPNCFTLPGSCDPSDGQCDYTAVVCDTPPNTVCYELDGTCDTSDGVCDYTPLTAGTVCGTCLVCDGDGACETAGNNTNPGGNCATGSTCCGGACTPLGTNTNCLSCGDVCPSGQTCNPVTGCQSVCPSPPPTSCNGVPDGCLCTANGAPGVCNAGSCDFACPGGSSDCVGNPINKNAQCCRRVGGVLACKTGEGSCVCFDNDDCGPDDGKPGNCCGSDGFCTQSCPPAGLTTNSLDVQECTPATCDQLGCGSHDDGCGTTLDCGECCTPKDICLDTDCGTVDDGCGGTLECPPCCTPLDCTTVGTCGTGLSDDCGGLIDCPCPDAPATDTPVICVDDNGKCDPAADVCCNPNLTCKGTGRRGVYKCQ